MLVFAFILASQQNKYAGCDGKDGQDDAQFAHRNKCRQARQDEPDAQEQKSDIFGEFHDSLHSCFE
jgi:hypothetical protein